MLFNHDFKDMLSALSDAEIDFLIVGAYEMNCFMGSCEESVSGFRSEPNRGFQGISGQKECIWVVGNLILQK